jgi:acetyl-CoA carboxylase biotin carboxyl carrier protein
MPERDEASRHDEVMGARPGPAERQDPSGTRHVDGSDARTPAARLSDHAAIERLASDLLPALVARLSGTGLGELEVREGDWRVRLRRPALAERRPVERHGRAVRGSGRDGARDGGHVTDHEPLVHGPAEEGAPGRRLPLVATSPAVGIFRTRGELPVGSRVRAGDRLAIVDLLGVPQDVLAPGDAVVAALFVEDGDAVEYGQVLLALEPVGTPEHDVAPQPVQVG